MWLLLRGMGVTIEVSVISLIIATFLGFFSCLSAVSSSKWWRIPSKIYVWIIRGTPLIVQVYYIYFAFPQLIQSFHVNFRISSPLTAGIIALSLNAGAYISEIFRGGVEAVDIGQIEAARSLGFSRRVAMIKVVLPQAVRISIPALVNQFITSLKDTSIISAIGLYEIVYEAKVYIGTTMESFATWTVVAATYLVVVTILSRFSSYVEKRIGTRSNDDKLMAQ
jgi:His/Glu/Gln/Arg/opine family amino acid ABC transporter permease subunit